mmetsp:Transcript_14793/g.25166  ORF Transcript_14793/g.25166 Transcript_14793/m.25166 type:complete len:106 (-) Transcript_14793:32-349(-)
MEACVPLVNPQEGGQRQRAGKGLSSDFTQSPLVSKNQYFRKEVCGRQEEQYFSQKMDDTQMIHQFGVHQSEEQSEESEILRFLNPKSEKPEDTARGPTDSHFEHS